MSYPVWIGPPIYTDHTHCCHAHTDHTHCCHAAHLVLVAPVGQGKVPPSLHVECLRV